VIKKAKGIKSNSLSVDDYIKMRKGDSIKTAIKTFGIKDYSDGSVTIKDELVTLNSDGYTRREKIFNKQGL
jgi:hypothetical protein